jgi:cyclic lactone autoinducer peptide
MKGGKTMKKILLYISSLVASFAFIVTSSNVNTTCAFLIHQPKLPQGAEKLSKH